MALTPISTDLNIITALDDEPNDVGGLTAAQLKAKYDEGTTAIKTYINDTMIPELDADHLPYEYGSANSIKTTMENLTVGVMPDDSVTAAKLAEDAAIGNIADGTVAIAKIASAAFASQAEAEAGTENTKVTTSLRMAQAITALGTVFSSGTITGSSSGSGTATKTLPFTPTFVVVRSATSAPGKTATALLLSGDSQMFYNSGDGATTLTASFSGTTLTITNGTSLTAATVCNYVAFR